MAGSMNPALTGGARGVAKAGKLVTPGITQALADRDLTPLRFVLIGHDAAAFKQGDERAVIRRERSDPLLVAARAALAREVKSTRPAVVFRDGRPPLTVRGSLASLARLDVLEDGRGLVRWWPYGGPAP